MFVIFALADTFFSNIFPIISYGTIMKTIEKIDELKKVIAALKSQSKRIGFVPTMGALHPGHLSLVDRSRNENDITIVSVFVNPIQFNDPNDLRNYPRDIKKDLALLQSHACDIVFHPGVSEMYPEPDRRSFNLNKLDKIMEGKSRAGHFNGVAIVVTKLFEMVNPDKAYFGEKDFQQLTIIKYLVNQLHIAVKIIGCPIIREKDGLAMSSRNALLNPDERKLARIIPETLFEAQKIHRQYSVKDLTNWVKNRINGIKGVQLDYFEIVRSTDLQPVISWDEKDEKIGCVAVKIGKVRLIDNVKFNA